MASGYYTELNNSRGKKLPSKIFMNYTLYFFS